MAVSSLFQTLCLDSTLHAAWRQVKSKNSAGGIDGISLAEFEKELYKEVQILITDLRNGKWKPQPYLQIEIPKKNKEEIRKLGLLSVRDKVVQHAIKLLVEPRAERLFINNSYGYRPGKGATKAIRRSLQECRVKKNKWALRLDIDNFFDTIDHTILNARLHALINDPEIVRLMMLVIKMGKIAVDGTWVETQKGIPQGAVLSPLLANIYLHSFDQFILYRELSYVRYADDFIIFCKTREQAETILGEATTYLQNKLKLSLNPPIITEINKGFEFLGITLSKYDISVSEEKRKELMEKIAGLEFDACGFSSKSLKSWMGICNYYAQLLPQSDLELFDQTLIDRLQTILAENYKKFVNKPTLQRALDSICFLSKQYSLNKKKTINELTDDYLIKKRTEHSFNADYENRKIISARKSEYRKKEASTSELLVNKPGTFIGLTNRGVTVREKGKVLSQQNIQSLSHIVVIGKGISLSSNLLEYCMNNKLPIDFFDVHGIHIGSFLSPKFMEETLWETQALASVELRGRLALDIITGKLKNQFNLIKYFHKYHKTVYPNLIDKYQVMEEWIHGFTKFRKLCNCASAQITKQLMGFESQAAIRYWAYIRELFADDQITFVKRERKGATDIVNCMLNYGYAILYVRVWQALLAAKLNPFDSVLHTPQANKPTLVYDVTELFRSQVVDRVVISMVQKGTELTLNKGLLSDTTRQLLAKNIMERLNRYEKYRGKELKMEQIILRQCMDLAICFKNEEHFKPYIAKW
ncbi:CRISPR-associated endonuclease Cas1 [Bacteroides bouchesdurhonensis]